MNIFFGNDELSFSYVVFNSVILEKLKKTKQNKTNRKELSKSQLISFYWNTKAIILGLVQMPSIPLMLKFGRLIFAVCDVVFMKGKVGSKSQPIFALFASSAIVICQLIIVKLSATCRLIIQHCGFFWCLPKIISLLPSLFPYFPDHSGSILIQYFLENVNVN